MKAFLSHSSADKQNYVNIVAQHLSKEDVIYDEISFEAGEKNIDEIIRGLDSTTVFCIFISNASLNSKWVQQELEGAAYRMGNGSLKLIYPVLIDREVRHDDPRIPKWLQENYNLKLVPRPVIAALHIKQKLRQASWEKHPKLGARARIFIGRNAQIEAFERRFDDYAQPKPVLSVVGGPSSIGRRTLILNTLRKLSLTSENKEIPVLHLERHASIEDFILRLLDLGYSDMSYVDLNLTESSLNDKIAIAVTLLASLMEYDARVIFLDEGCLVTFERKLAPWFAAIVNDVKLAGKPLIFVASRWSLSPTSARDLLPIVFSCSLGELNSSERNRLFSRLLEIENITLKEEDFITFTDLLNGFPDEVFFAVDLITRFGIHDALQRCDEIVAFNGEKASLLLKPFKDKSDTLDVIKLLAQSEIFSVEFLCQIFNTDQLRPIIADLTSEHICEFIGEEGAFIKLMDSVRDSVKRNNLNLPNDLLKKVQYAVAQDIQRGNWNEYDSSRVAFLVKNALAQGEKLPPKIMIPSHMLRAIKELYFNRGNLQHAVQLADTLLLKEKNLTHELAQDVRYYLCLALARLRDSRVLTEVQKIQGDEHNFILGYYYRLAGRQRDAVERLSSILTTPLVGIRAKRELVEVLLQMEQYDEGRELAQKNYEENRTNQFHIQAYFRTLVLGSSPERHLTQLQTLCSELESVGSDRSRQMAMIGRALISARCKHDPQALNLIDDAIGQHPTVIYPLLAKFDIGMSFRNESAMQDAIDGIASLEHKGAALSTKTLGIQRAYISAIRGDIENAKKIAREVTKNFTDEARVRFLEKLAGLNGGGQVSSPPRR